MTYLWDDDDTWVNGPYNLVSVTGVPISTSQPSYDHPYLSPHSSYTPRYSPPSAYEPTSSPHIDDYHHYSTQSQSLQMRGRNTSSASSGVLSSSDPSFVGTSLLGSPSDSRPSIHHHGYSRSRAGYPSDQHISKRHENEDYARMTPKENYCTHTDCLDEHGRPKKFFSRKADVVRHVKSMHETNLINCPKKNCTRKGEAGFTRYDHLTEHLRGYHLEDIPKRTAGNKGQKSRSPDKSLRRSSNHSSNNDGEPQQRPFKKRNSGSFSTNQDCKNIDMDMDFNIDDLTDSRYHEQEPEQARSIQPTHFRPTPQTVVPVEHSASSLRALPGHGNFHNDYRRQYESQQYRGMVGGGKVLGFSNHNYCYQ